MDLKDYKLLMVGAGGIGCELLKNLILTGFSQIEVIDLDTIELSNLNRQFLFQKCHVGKPKATTARESVLRYNPDANIVAHHDSIMSTKYDVTYFKQFALVLNALDNKAARSHVNRLCLAADIPLIESGSAGYLGQVTLIKKGVTECYDCLMKPAPKTFPGCTIRNTPSEPIHCIVWAKHLFNQLFGTEDPDEAVSPDGEDPENMADAGKAAVEKAESAEAVTRVSTRQWAKETNYNAEKIFNKLFCDDIKYLLSMTQLWEKRKPPTPIVWENCVEDATALDQISQQQQQQASTSRDSEKLASHKILTMQQYCELFRDSVATLCKRLNESGDSEEEKILVWDKDDQDAMKFVTAASNLRCFVFSISPKSQFETKSLAGNIIPAIATTNAIVAGLIVVQALKVLDSRPDECKTAYVRDKPSSNKIIVGTQLVKPNPSCYVCASKPEISIKLNMNTFTVKQFETKVLKQELNMIQPDMETDDGTGRIIISSEPGETEENDDKFLGHFFAGQTMVALKCDDFFQNYELKINLIHSETLDEGNVKEYEIVSENQLLKDQRSDLQTAPTVDVCMKIDENATEVTVISPTEEKKRRYDAAFEGENATSAVENNKKPRKSNESLAEVTEQNECEPVEQDDDSNSINDASDALSEEEEEEEDYRKEEVVKPKIAKTKKQPRETIIDDDIIIEEDSNDLKSDEEQSNQNTENSTLNWLNQESIQFNGNNNTNSNIETYTNNTNSNAYCYNEESNRSSVDNDVIECSSDGSDIIEINDEVDVDSENSHSHSSSSYRTIDPSGMSPSKVMRLSNGNNNGMNGGHFTCQNGEAGKEYELKLNGQVKGNLDANSYGTTDDSITLID